MATNIFMIEDSRIRKNFIMQIHNGGCTLLSKSYLRNSEKTEYPCSTIRISPCDSISLIPCNEPDVFLRISGNLSQILEEDTLLYGNLPDYAVIHQQITEAHRNLTKSFHAVPCDDLSALIFCPPPYFIHGSVRQKIEHFSEEYLQDIALAVREIYGGHFIIHNTTAKA